MSSIEPKIAAQAAGAGAPATAREVRKFGVVMIAGFGLIGAFFRWRGYETGPLVLWAIGGALGAFALALPGPARPVHRAWMAFAHVVGRVNATIILTLLYLVAFTPLALFFRLIGRDALRLRFEPGRASYWEEKARPAGGASYFNQF